MKLSPMQMSLLLHSLISQETIYVQQLIYRLDFKLNLPCFRSAWQQVFDRHEILRVAFRWKDLGEPVQDVHAHVDAVINEIDLRFFSPEQQAVQVDDYLRHDRRTQFDFSRPPMVRLALLQLSDQESLFLFTLHHAVLDGRSRKVLIEEAFLVYNALCSGETIALPLAAQFREYIAWLNGQDWEEGKDYWRNLFMAGDHCDLMANLACGKAAQGGIYSSANWPEVTVDSALTNRLESLARDNGFTLNTIVQACWVILMHRYSGHATVTFGAARACRHLPIEGIARMAGLLINTVPLRACFTLETRVIDVLTALRTQSTDVGPFETTPLAKIQEFSGIETGRPLFETIVVFEQHDLNHMPGLEGRPYVPTGARRFSNDPYPLSLFALGRPSLRFEIGYDRLRFDQAFIGRLVQHYLAFLQELPATLTARVSDLHLLSDSELRHLITELNQTEVRYPMACVHELFEAQALKTPSATAINYCGTELTYQELQTRANQLASYLAGRGVKAERLVGVYMDRCPEMIVALLGILKAGGAYVPLDPAYPADRLNFMIGDAGLELLLTKKSQGPPVADVRVIDLEAEWDQIARAGGSTVPSGVMPQNLAYVIYTSGSTGRPKGVAVEHRQVCNQLFWAGSALSLGPTDRILQKASFSFDASILEIFLPLSCGARIVMAEPVGEQDVDYLLRLIIEDRVTYSDMVPSQLDVLLNHPSISQWKSLRVLTCGAEALKPELVSRFYARLFGSLWNTYGPTETTVQSTFTPCAPDDGYVPIGKPIANTTLYILGPDQQPVPLGLAGELYIGGEGVTRGYWKRPEITATKFVPDPFTNSPGGRLYRTGDFVRYHPDGNLEFLGRLDQLVKIRGFRIELEEIEAVLCRHEGVAQAAVIAAQDESNQKLRAFIVAKPGQNPTTRDLRALIQRELPAYMMPASFVTLQRLPLMPNGKLNRTALARHSGQSSDPLQAEPPRTPAEELLAAIWSKVLKTGTIGRQENFLHLGGHSLLAMQVVSQIRNVFHVDIPLRSVLEFGTIESLAAHIQDQFGKLPGVSKIAPRQGSRAIAPIGMAQQRLWFLQQLEPFSYSYNVPTVLRLRGPVNYGGLENALAEIIRRHESLRTYFRKSGLDEEPVQVIEPALPFKLSTVDLQSISSEPAISRAQAMIREETRRPFHLEQGPLVRALLLRIALDEHIFVLVLHHIVCDGWSMRIFARELAALYAAFMANEKSLLPELPVQYADYVLWQREWLREEVVRGQLAYWRQQLGGDIERLSLPAAGPRPEMQTFDSHRVTFDMPVEIVTKMKELALRQEVTLFMYLLAGLMVLLHRYSGETRSVVVGTPIAGRNVPEVEDLIGFFANTLALRCDLDGNPLVTELLRRVREAALGAYAHQDVPFEKIVEELRPERDLSSTPLFQVMLAVENAAGPEWKLRGLHVNVEEIETAASKFDLTVNLEIGTALHGAFIYNTNVLEHGVVEGMARHFVHLLQQMTSDVNTRLGDLSLLDGREYQQVIVEWNRTGMAHPAGCIHHLFEKQAVAVPQACAVEYNGKRLSYEQLNQRSNQLAHYLIQRGIGPEKLVGICMDRSLEMIVALLAILKAGGVYVPLDPRYPPDRISFILRETQAAVLLTGPEHLDQVSSSSAEILLLPRLWEQTRAENTENPWSAVEPGNLSYLIYTSGSTGKPKGVAIEHRNAVSLLHWARSVFSAKDLSGVLASTSICFDLSVFEIFVPLSWGGTVLLVNNVLELPELASRRQVSLVNSVPSLIAELLGNGKMPACVETVNLAGEPLSATLVNELYEQRGVQRVFDLYGPSEDTTYSTFILRGAGAREMIGRPLANKQTYVLNRYQQPVPPGVSGELFIGGEGVARGYFWQPALTAEKFVPDPFSGNPGSRLYRTGDKVRYDADGNLEFQGRLDQQIKIRGFRIELGEIESVLTSHSRVQQALVMAVADDLGGRRLAAYMTVDPANPPEIDVLRAFAKQKLPEYMVPFFFIVLEKFPLNSNGKIDRKALPKPELKQDTAYQPPRNSLERAVSACWEELLRLDRVGIHDNFFDLGGHSMLLLRLQGRLERALERSIDVQVLFRHLTVESQAAYLAESANAPQPGPAIERVERRAFLPISCQEEMVWTLCQIDSRHLAYNVIRGVRMIGDLDSTALEQAWKKLMERHEILRTGFILQDRRPARTIHTSLPFQLEATDLQDLAPDLREPEAMRLATLECNLPFALAEPPLYRARLFKLSRQEHVLSIVFHHIIIDAVSLSVLLEELSSFYAAYYRGDSPPPELPLQYADYAAWQRNHLLTRLPELERFWTARLDGLSSQLKLSHGRGTQDGSTAPAFAFQLGGEETKALKRFSRHEKVTLFDLLLAVFKLLVHQETGATDIAVGVSVANRGRRELERMVGFFSNLIILRTSLSNQPTFRQLLHRVHETAQESYAYQDMPFQYLIEKLRLEPVQRRLFQVKFIFINDSDRNLEIPGLLTEEVRIGTEHQAGNEISFYIHDEGSHLSFLVAYKPSLFTRERIEDFSKKYQGLLAQVIASPCQKIDRFASEALAVAEG